MSWIGPVTLSLCVLSATQELSEALSDVQINDALRLAQDDKAGQALLNLYTLQTRTGLPVPGPDCEESSIPYPDLPR